MSENTLNSKSLHFVFVSGHSGNNATTQNANSAKSAVSQKNEERDESSLSKSAQKRIRTVMTPHQYKVLRKVLQHTSFPPSELRTQLSKVLNMPSRTIQIWFQNQRQKSKQQGKSDEKKVVRNLGETPWVQYEISPNEYDYIRQNAKKTRSNSTECIFNASSSQPSPNTKFGQLISHDELHQTMKRSSCSLDSLVIASGWHLPPIDSSRRKDVPILPSLAGLLDVRPFENNFCAESSVEYNNSLDCLAIAADIEGEIKK